MKAGARAQSRSPVLCFGCVLRHDLRCVLASARGEGDGVQQADAGGIPAAARMLAGHGQCGQRKQLGGSWQLNAHLTGVLSLLVVVAASGQRHA